jgi:ATP phosphoribosyltransferase regulatory subunit
MVYQPPSGARDLLPLDVAQKSWIEDRLQQVLHRWGYQRIITSTLERMETLMAGGAIAPREILQLQSSTDESLGLRPEFTASIARTAVMRLSGQCYPSRLYYNANVFRRPEEGSHSTQQEFYQAGVELLGGRGVLADAEILLLVMDCLNGLGLADRWQMVLGDAGLTRSLLWEFPKPLRVKVRHALAHLDRVALETMPMEDDLRSRALQILNLRGAPEQVIEALNQMPLDDYQQRAASNLQSLLLLLKSTAKERKMSDRLPIVLDLSLIRTFDYYTGIVFEVIGDPASGQQILGQGGRYDELLGTYHPQSESIPGIGFSLEIERLHHILLPTGQLPSRTRASEKLVVAESSEVYPIALAHAHHLREANPGIQVEIYLRSPDGTLPIDRAEIMGHARQQSISEMIWIRPDGTIVSEKVGKS